MLRTCQKTIQILTGLLKTVKFINDPCHFSIKFTGINYYNSVIARNEAILLVAPGYVIASFLAANRAFFITVKKV
jgi:hypothetical protein